MKKTNETAESRRAKLEARRYHVYVLMEAQCQGLRRSGELFFNSLRAARDEVRKLFHEWEGWSMTTTYFKPSDWREIWASTFFEMTFTEEHEPAYHFRAQIVDTKAPPRKGGRPFQIDSDFPSDPTESEELPEV